MKKVLLSPGKVIIGKNEMENLGAYAALYGSRALLIAHRDDSARVQPMLDKSSAESGVTFINAAFSGECTYAEVARIMSETASAMPDCVIGLGGGKAIDTAKCLSDKAKLPMISVPTIVSTDAPCSSMAVVYDENHGYVENYYLKRSPALVLIDSQIIANAPVRFLVSGMGDAFATYYEAELCVRTNAKNYGGGASTRAAFEMAKLCRELLLADGAKAAMACRAHTVTPALENIIEANTLLSGIGFESVGLAAAHCICTVLFELGAHSAMHGELVAFGLLVQFVLENRPLADIRETVAFYKSVGLPVSLKEIGLDPEKIPDSLWTLAAEIGMSPSSTMRNMPVTVSNESIKPAILLADKLSAL